MNRGQTGRKCILNSRIEARLQYLMSGVWPIDQCLSIVQEDACRIRMSLTKPYMQVYVPVGLPDESLTIKPPDTSSGKGPIDWSTRGETHSACMSLLCNTMRRPATQGSFSKCA